MVAGLLVAEVIAPRATGLQSWKRQNGAAATSKRGGQRDAAIIADGDPICGTCYRGAGKGSYLAVRGRGDRDVQQHRGTKSENRLFRRRFNLQKKRMKRYTKFAGSSSNGSKSNRDVELRPAKTESSGANNDRLSVMRWREKREAWLMEAAAA